MEGKRYIMTNTINIPIARSLQDGANIMPIRRFNSQWEAAVPVGRYHNGRVKYKRKIVDSEEEAKYVEREMLEEIKQAVFALQPKKQAKKAIKFKSVSEKWIANKKQDVSLKTWQRYKQIIDKHLLPYFGKYDIGDITEEDINSYLSSNSNCSTTLRQHYVILSGILGSEQIDIIKNVKRPKKRERVIDCIRDPAELASFVMSLNGILFLPVYLAANTGMRFSEIAGLMWKDVDLINGYITVNRALHWDRNDEGKRFWYINEDCKTKYSRRTIKINNHDIRVLREAKDSQEGKHGDFVCMDSRGQPIAKDTHGTNFRKYAKGRGYQINFHSLRHSHATILIMIYKVPIKTVSRRLGHSDISVTLGIYSHVIQEQDELACMAMENVFAEAQKNTK